MAREDEPTITIPVRTEPLNQEMMDHWETGERQGEPHAPKTKHLEMVDRGERITEPTAKESKVAQAERLEAGGEPWVAFV